MSQAHPFILWVSDLRNALNLEIALIGGAALVLCALDALLQRRPCEHCRRERDLCGCYRARRP